MRKSLSIFFAAFFLLTSSFVFSSCSSKGNKNNCVVSFCNNYGVCFLDGVETTYITGLNSKLFSEYKSITVSVGEYIEAPDEPSPYSLGNLYVNYVFGGWYKEPSCETPFDFNNEKVNNSITLYAKWIKSSKTFEIPT